MTAGDAGVLAEGLARNLGPGPPPRGDLRLRPAPGHTAAPPPPRAGHHTGSLLPETSLPRRDHGPGQGPAPQLRRHLRLPSPAAALRRREFKERVTEDFRRIPEILHQLRSDPPPPERPLKPQPPAKAQQTQTTQASFLSPNCTPQPHSHESNDSTDRGTRRPRRRCVPHRQPDSALRHPRHRCSDHPRSAGCRPRHGPRRLHTHTARDDQHTAHRLCSPRTRPDLPLGYHPEHPRRYNAASPSNDGLLGRAITAAESLAAEG